MPELKQTIAVIDYAPPGLQAISEIRDGGEIRVQLLWKGKRSRWSPWIRAEQIPIMLTWEAMWPKS